jgi:GT2 family glycosyltransferase
LEDLDLAYRVIKKNKKIVYSDKAIVFHPAIEFDLIQYIKRLKFMRCYFRLFLKNPEFGNTKQFLLFRVFIRPFSITRWKKCLKNPEKIPKFLTINIIESMYCLYLYILTVLKKT